LLSLLNDGISFLPQSKSQVVLPALQDFLLQQVELCFKVARAPCDTFQLLCLGICNFHGLRCFFLQMRLFAPSCAKGSFTALCIVCMRLSLLLRFVCLFPKSEHLRLAKRCLSFEVTAKLILSFTNTFQLLGEWANLQSLLAVVLVPGNQLSLTSNLKLCTAFPLSSDVTAKLLLNFQRSSQLGLERISHSNHRGQLLISRLDATSCFRLLVEPSCLQSFSL